MTAPVAAVDEVPSRIAAVRARIRRACERAGRDPADITLIGVSKTQPADAVAVAYAAGLRDFGENRVQESIAKIATLAAAGIHPAWHLIGHLQTNKAKAATDAFAILHAVDSDRLLRAISSVATRMVRVMIEVNVAGEETKFGVAPRDVAPLLAVAQGLHDVRVVGLMTVAPQAGDPELVRPVFRTLRELAVANGLEQLSMGMTEDFEVAVEEGATHVRVGRAIFGERL
jgi:PLP dependent protein